MLLEERLNSYNQSDGRKPTTHLRVRTRCLQAVYKKVIVFPAVAFYLDTHGKSL